MKNRSKSILGVIVVSIGMAIGVLITQNPHPINLNTHELQAVMVHCDASPEGRDVKAWQVAEFHMRSRSKGGRGWSKPGYNDVIELNGNVVNLVPYNEDTIVQLSELANGACEFNRIVRHVCYIGGMNKEYTAPKNTLTTDQDSALKNYLFAFLKQHPSAWIIAHNQVATKACPSFDIVEKCRQYGIPEKNIYKKPKLTKNNEKILDSLVNRAVNSKL